MEQAWIEMVPERDAEGELAEYYGRCSYASGRVDCILKIHSLNPPSLKHHYELYVHLMRGQSPLSRLQREMIAVVVSTANECHY